MFEFHLKQGMAQSQEADEGQETTWERGHREKWGQDQVWSEDQRTRKMNGNQQLLGMEASLGCGREIWGSVKDWEATGSLWGMTLAETPSRGDMEPEVVTS